MGSIKSHLEIKQPALGGIGLVALLCIGELLTPMALDMYTPAVPHMAQNFGTTESAVNLTILGYYLFLAVGMLIFGPLSDKYGRRPPLLISVMIYTIGGAFCAISFSIEMLIVSRITQAFGSGGISAICMSIVKDSFASKFRENVLALVQVLMNIAPILAPIIGAVIVQFTNWRITFWVLAATGIAILVIAILLRETLPQSQRTNEDLKKTLGRLGVVAKNPGFTSFLIIINMSELPFMAYVAVGSYIYMDFFGRTEMEYSLFFAVASVVMIAGPPTWIAISKYISAKRFTTIMLVACVLIGFFMLFAGPINEYLFCASFMIFAYVVSVPRPYATNIVLEQQEQDTGSAAALLNVGRTLIGCVGMVIIMLPWPNFIIGVAVTMIVFMAIALVAWIGVLKSKIVLVGIKDKDPTNIM